MHIVAQSDWAYGALSVSSLHLYGRPNRTDPTTAESLQLVEASVTGGVDALAAALKGTDAVVSALGARPSFNFKQPWEVGSMFRPVL
jgi:hypothetical protein